MSEFPVSFEKEGLVVLPDVEINGERLKFILDTGATRSALFERAHGRLFASDNDLTEVNIHGLSSVGSRELINVPMIRLGQFSFSDQTFVVLPNRQKSIQYDGLLGMDILGEFSLHFSRRNSFLRLIPKDLIVEVPSNWQDVPLFPNPFIEDDRSLHFFEMQMSGDTIPVLLDTGAELNIMNWGLKSHPKLRKVYDALRKDWEYQGATGKFRPSIKVRVDLAQANEAVWKNKEFIIMKLDGLEILGVEDRFMAIIGLGFLENDEVFIDFERNILAVKPKYRIRNLVEPKVYLDGLDF
jgi:predicted aspartyl protease